MSTRYQEEINRLAEEIRTDSFNLEVKKGVLESLKRMARNADRESATKILGPTDAVKEFFNLHPTRQLKPKEIEAGLNEMIDNGTLKIKTGKSPSEFLRGILFNLRKEGAIIRITPSDNKRDVYYRKKKG